jgi:2-polyprenyl-3-methyl-5-hydroxy-6-metoxy-1,4-benzoquinol methylase
MDNPIKNFYTEICELLPSHRSFINEALNCLTVQEKEFFNHYICYCVSCGQSFKDIVYSYLFIVKETFREQMYFKRHKKYRFSKYTEVADSVYNNQEYMQKYMTGLAVSTFMWPNHIEIKRFFEMEITSTPLAIRGQDIDSICNASSFSSSDMTGKTGYEQENSKNRNSVNRVAEPSSPFEKKINYLEVGPGHGIFFMIAMNCQCAHSYDAIDISPTSVKMTNDMLDSGYFGKFSNYNITERDFLRFNPPQQYDFLVMGEVIEHVEQPLEFLKKAYTITTEQPFVFVTTCINAPEIDHIYLFSTINEVYELIAATGFRIVKECIIPYNGTTLERSINEDLPINLAFVLGK